MKLKNLFFSNCTKLRINCEIENFFLFEFHRNHKMKSPAKDCVNGDGGLISLRIFSKATPKQSKAVWRKSRTFGTSLTLEWIIIFLPKLAFEYI